MRTALKDYAEAGRRNMQNGTNEFGGPASTVFDWWMYNNVRPTGEMSDASTAATFGHTVPPSLRSLGARMTQLGTVQAQAAEKHAKAPANWRSARWFFVCMASVLVLIVAVGFAPSFYLPSVIRPEQSAAGKYDFPTYIVVHGILLTSWFLLLFTQALLIATKRVHSHRSLGIAGVAIAAVLVPLSALVVTRSVARSNLGALAVIGDYGGLLLFTLLVSLAILNRAKPDVHKRLMLIASISIAAPAIVRWPGAETVVPLSVLVPQVTLFAALIVHDLVTGRRVHPATGWGIAAYLVVAGVCVPLAMSNFGQLLVNSLR